MCGVGLISSAAARIRALLGVSAYARPVRTGALTLESPQVEHVRKMRGGSLQPLPVSQTRWYMSDLEAAERYADAGDLSQAARLMRAARGDGHLAGVLSTRTDGLVRLPKRFRGRPEIIAALELGHDKTRSVFDEMCPATELGLLAADGVLVGVGGGEMVPVEGRDYPLFVRHDPEFFRYRAEEGRWYFRSVAGEIPITPGDGRWVLHVPGGRRNPWHHGLWRAIGKAFIRKTHAGAYKDNWEGKLANPARVAVAPQGATDAQTQSWFRRVMAWGVNTVFGLKPGYDVKLLETNGRGHESFEKTIADQNDEYKMAVAGQLVTSDGGAGFQNSDIHRSIRADLIKATADALAYTVNTQILPPFIVERFGIDALEDGAVVEWDVTPPRDRAQDSAAMSTAAQALDQLTKALAAHGLHVDAKAFATRFGIPLTDNADVSRADVPLAKALELAQARGLQPDEASVRAMLDREGIVLEPIPKGESQPKSIPLAPTDIAKVVQGGEARRSVGLDLFGDERDDKTITELGESAAADAKAEADTETPAEHQEAA